VQCDTLIIGNLVLPHGVLEGGGLAIKDGRIVGIHTPGNLPESANTLDHTGQLVLPGGIDTHVHAFSSSQDQEGIHRLTRGAARGGLTTVVEMPYDRPQAVTTPERFRAKVEVVEREAVVDVALYATLAKYGGWREVEGLARAGACAFKLSTYETDPERFPEIPDSELLKAFREIAKTGLLVAFHAENGDIVDPLVKELREFGEIDPTAHCLSRPPVSESTAVAKLLELAQVEPVRLHIVHLTVPTSYDLIDWHRGRGLDVTAETCIHYLVLSMEQMPELKAYGKMNPPLRSAEMRDELWESTLMGQVDFVTSDHAPWTEAMKEKPNIFDNASGLPGVETLLPLLYSEGVVKRGMDLLSFTDLIATNPARRFNLFPRKGALVPGGDADVCILDPNASWQVQASQSESVAKWSPFAGMELTGKIVRTIVRGREVFDGMTVTASSGSGQFIRPASSSPVEAPQVPSK
jgi:allantoinase